MSENGVEVLRVVDITKDFPGVRALDKVHFDLASGEVHALVGENGAGKSTLVKIISGAYKQDAGEIYFQGERIEIQSPRDAIERGISTIHQEFNLVPSLDAAANIFLGREPRSRLGKINKKMIIEWTKELFDRIGLEADPRTPVKSLSVAQKQLVEICKAISIDAKVLIMDEPTAVLAKKEKDQLFETIRALKDRGIAIIYISHRLEELFHIADRVTVLRDGQYVGTVKISDADKHSITRMMIGRDISDQYPKDNQPSNTEVLRVENLTWGRSVRGVSFHVSRGEILGISGLVGSGTSELGKLIFGVIPPDSGRIFLENRELRLESPKSAIDNGLVLVPEDRKLQGLILGLDIEENLTLASLDLLGSGGIIRGNSLRRTSLDIITKLNIRPPDPHRAVKTLSGGNQQKVVVGKWLLKPSKVFIFAEPTRGVDVGAKVEIYRLISEIANRGAAVIVISSDLQEILGLSDRILVMKDGRVAREFDRKEANEELVMSNAL